MPVTVPATSDVNFVPRTTEPGSPASTVSGVPDSISEARGVTAPEALDAGPVPAALVALTVNV